MNKTYRIALAAFAAFALVLAACSDSGDATTTTAGNGTTTVASGTSAPTTTLTDTPQSTTTTDASRGTTTTVPTTAPGTTTTTTGNGGTVGTTTTTTGGGTGGSAYGTDQQVLSDQCIAGDDIACDILFLISSPDTEFETTGATCAGRETEGDFCSGYNFADENINEYGDHPFLDALYDMCDIGGFKVGCGLLCDLTPAGSAYEAFGCANAPFTFGDDPFLDSLWTACEDGDFQACDDLFFASPFDSEYEAFGDNCGNRNEPQGSCVELYG